ncbi:MAG: tetratricopeptide repeat protein [Thermoplasmata archaeon]|jgi:tetratricopeptide (TPR) repeat protein|nr:tetratricopeptide repeat protein [Thermoplasmata archaeon]
MATRNEIESLLFYVLGETNRQNLIASGLEAVPKDSRVAALRGLQDLGWIGHCGLADYEESYSLTKDGRVMASQRPDLSSLDSKVREHIEALRHVDTGQNGVVKEGLKQLISIQSDLGCTDSALLNCYRLKSIAERTKDVEAAAFAAYNEGKMESAQNKWDEALESYLTAIEKFMEAGDRRGVCMTNRVMGVVYGNKGDHASAVRCFESSLTMAREIGDRDAIAKAEGNLAIIYDLEGRTEESEKASKSCLDYFLEVGDNIGAARSANNLGVLNLSRDNLQMAGEYFEKTIAASRACKEHTLLGTALVNAGYCYARTGDAARALAYSDEAMKIFRELCNQNMIALAYRNYGTIEARNGHFDEAFALFEKSVRSAKASGVEDTLAACCYEYGTTLIKATVKLHLASKLLKKASAIYRSIGNTQKAREAEARAAAI